MGKVQDVKKSSLTFAPEAGTQRMRDIINKGLTEEVICRYGAIELADLQQDLQERDQKAYVLCRFMKENYPAFADCDIPNEKSECYAWLKKRITYMYC